MPTAKQGKAYKFARPFHGPYRVVEVFETGASVRRIDDPQQDSIRVAFDRLRPCSSELLDTCWPSRSGQNNQVTPLPDYLSEEEDVGVWSGRLHHYAVEDACHKSGDL